MKAKKPQQQISRKELVDNVLRPAFENEKFEDVVGDVLRHPHAHRDEVRDHPGDVAVNVMEHQPPLRRPAASISRSGR